MAGLPPVRCSFRGRTGQRLLALSMLALALFAVILIPACTNTIVAPTRLNDPVSVFVLDFGHTAGLVLPTEAGIVHYTYGDWRYYALSERSFGSGFAALLLPTPATLGRREYDEPAAVEAIRRLFLLPRKHIYAVSVERERADALRSRLDAQFREFADSKIYNREHDLEFVRNGLGTYTVLHNSNHRIARWLREMDCEVRGLGGLSRWNVRTRDDDESAM